MLRRVLIIFMILLGLSPLQVMANQTGVEKYYVLLDTSGSMRGAKLEEAKQLLYNALGDNNIDYITIYSFAGNQMPSILTGSTKTELEMKITQATAKSRTPLYDAIYYLLSQNETKGQDILVLSDVADSQSKTTLSELLLSLQTSNTRVSFIESLIDSKHIQEAENIARVSGGSILEEFKWLRPEPATNAPSKRKSSTGDQGILLLGISTTSALLSFLVAVKSRDFIAHRRRRTELKNIINSNSIEIENSSEETSWLSSKFKRVLQLFDLDTYFKTTRSKTGFLFLCLLVAFGLYRLTDSLLITAVLTVGLTLLFLITKQRQQENRLLREFEMELPGALKMLASSLASGLSFLQALSAYSEDGQGQSAREFKRALAEIQLGVPIERALDSVAKRMKSDDLRWAISAFALQREVGGSLATILNSTAQTIESRFELRREVRTLSAEGRISSYILMLLPIGIFIFLTFLRPAYVQLFVTEPVGNLLLIFVILALITAGLWLKSIIKIEV